MIWVARMHSLACCVAGNEVSDTDGLGERSKQHDAEAKSQAKTNAEDMNSMQYMMEILCSASRSQRPYKVPRYRNQKHAKDSTAIYACRHLLAARGFLDGESVLFSHAVTKT